MYAEIGVQAPLATVALEVQVGHENIWKVCIPSPLKTSGLHNRIDPKNPPAQETAENQCIFLPLGMLHVYYKSVTSTKSAASEQK